MFKLNDKTQKIVADILTRFMFSKNMDDVFKVWDEIYKEYHLYDDPFTHTPCSEKEYFDNCLEYKRQFMIDKYGHSDGLEG